MHVGARPDKTGRIALVADAATLATDVALQRHYLGVGTSLIEEDAA